MYCPNCAAPIDGAKFCRACGANVSLVPQALTGQLPTVPAADDDEYGRRRHRRRGAKPLSIEKAASSFFTGIGFLIASLAVMRYFPGGMTWGWAFLIPAFACIGDGVGQYLRLKEQERQQQFQPQYQQPQFNLPRSVPAPGHVDPRAPEISAPETSELSSPPSVTEHTTKNLDVSSRRE
jgi:hypothetical protein